AVTASSCASGWWTRSSTWPRRASSLRASGRARCRRCPSDAWLLPRPGLLPGRLLSEDGGPAVVPPAVAQRLLRRRPLGPADGARHGGARPAGGPDGHRALPG